MASDINRGARLVFDLLEPPTQLDTSDPEPTRPEPTSPDPTLPAGIDV